MSEDSLSFLDAGESAGESVAEPAVETESGEESAAPAQVETEQKTEGSGEPEDFDPKDPAEKTPEQRAGLRKALEAQRKRRKDAEQLVAELRGQLSVYQQQKPSQGQAEQAPQDPDESYYENPAKWTRDMVAQTERNLRLEMSRETMIAAHPDYAEVEQEFVQMADGNAGLLAELRSSPNPARFAYEYVKARKEMESIGSLDDLKAKLRQEVMAELEDGNRKKTALDAARKASTTSAGGAGVSIEHAAVDDESDFNRMFSVSY